MHGVGSRNKLTPKHAWLYPGASLLDALGRALCAVGVLPRKELHEAWEMAHRVRERFRGGRVVDLCSGFGVLAQVMLLVDETLTEAVAIDKKLPQNHGKVHDALAMAFPQLRGRVRFVEMPLERAPIAPGDLVVSAHACGALTDDVFARAVDAGARVAVLPCCHAYRWRPDLAGHPDPSRAMDEQRAERLSVLGYRVWTESIPEEVSPKNRLLLAEPTLPPA
jgi:hypothetical protein